MKYCVLYPQAKNVHLIKDVGMIAYKLHKLFGIDAHIACYDNEDYTYLKDAVRGLKIDYIMKKFNNSILDAVYYLKNNARDIDVLQIFHVTISSVIYAYLYKFFNRRGKVYLKLDCTEKLVEIIVSMSKIKRFLLNLFFNKVDVIGVEQKKIYNKLFSLLGKYSYKLLYTPNGIDYESTQIYKTLNYNNKENIIINVGRIGSPEKASDKLLKAFAKVKNIEKSDWKLVLVGPVEDSFKVFKNEFIAEHPYLKDRIEFKGAVYDRESLNRMYSTAKIFCSTSDYESFGIALLEGASFGNVIVSTNVGIAEELSEGGAGRVVNVGDVEGITKNLEEFMNSDNLKQLSIKMQKFCKDNYDWNEIVSRLYEKLGFFK